MDTTSSTHWPLYPFIRYSLLLLGLLSLSRLLLMGWLNERVGSLDQAFTVLMFGLRFDVIVICILWFIPALLLLLTPSSRFFSNLQLTISKVWLMLTTLLIVFLEISTPAFIDQYDTRPNRLFFEYLDTPVEVLKTSVLEYPWHFVVAVILMTLLSRYLMSFNRSVFAGLKPWPMLARLIMLPVLIVVLFLGARSSLDHRPANSSTAAFTNDQLVNKLGLSSVYTVLSAVNDLKSEEKGSSMYGSMDPAEMVGVVRKSSMLDADAFTDDPTSTWHKVKTKLPNNANLVIILEESLGAGYVGKLGGMGVTPELDKLADEGFWLTDLYATGTRSARGIESIVTGFLPSPSRSVLKLGLSQQSFPTLASLLKENGYETQFIYGGESHFDNMAGFFLANGFDKVTDDNDYSDPIFRGTWGVSDEDLFQRLDQELANASDHPQFILAFSSSSHGPYEFPDNRISLYDANKHTENNAVKYADYALGQFIKTAKTRDYWKNTYFLIVADHDTRVYGAALVPIKKFHIPGLILGPDISPEVYTKVTSQIDLPVTMLSYLGISTDTPLLGHDLNSLPDDFPGRAIMQYDKNNAYMRGNDVIIHLPNKTPKQFTYRQGTFTEKTVDNNLAKTAQAHALWPMYAYREKKYLYQ